MSRLETRELAYFLAVAEELHFGRAARRLGMAQPPLSRAIRQLERRIGVPLLLRENRRVTLTEAGRVLAAEAAIVLEAASAAVRRTQRAGRRDSRLVVAMKPGGDGDLLPAILAAHPAEPGAAEVDVVLCDVAERARLLRDGTADIAFLHSPYEDFTGLDTEPLLTEQAVVVLPRTHRLAEHTHLRLADLAGETMARWQGRPGQDGSGPEVRDSAQLMQLIAIGRTVAVVPESVRTQLRSDLACVPVLDATPVTLVLAWPDHSRSPALASFVRTAASIAARRRPHGGALPQVVSSPPGTALAEQ
ncbi:LysR family transcriptional regulator [Kitasatospora sp. NPDC097691]|uniref:LysR family transcriptional regulator n=1 Tax=Kitasatospora sp. NPDC097691 TaxID=3157231 RepID=UPI00332828D7